jgi:hypothetical protein
MPFDPSLPADNTRARASEIRSQLNALNNRFDTIPAGPAGPPGAPGQGFAFRGDWGAGTVYAPFDVVVWQGSAWVCLGATPGPGQPSPDADPLRWKLFARKGDDGAPGAQGPQGEQGPPFASVVVDSVATLSPGEPATVTASFDGVVHLAFGIPGGMSGAAGATGPQGAPGEVTNAALNAAIATTARNPDAIGPFTGTFSDPPTQAEMMAFAAYVESLRAATTR